MAKYMTQKMSSGVLPATIYYRVQSAHPSHGESGAFTNAATSDYATVHHIAVAEVEPGTYQSNQGVPTGGNTKEI
ncbi:MAG: hypothetical protein V4476_15525 [Pseudomonadota bacterium]